MYWLQFWPSNARDWVGLVGGIIVIAVALGGVLGWYLRVKLNGMGRRVLVTEKACQATSADVTTLKEQMQAANFEHGRLREAIGAAEGLQLRLMAQLDALDEKFVNHRLRQTERLVYLETMQGVVRRQADKDGGD